MNTTILTGRLVENPECRYMDNGDALCKTRIAVKRDGKNDNADFIPITVFGKQAENLQKYQQKGNMIGVNGYIRTGSYEKDGRKVYTWEVVAHRIEFLSFKEQAEPNEFDRIANEAIEREKQREAHDKQYSDMGFQAVNDEDIPF